MRKQTMKASAIIGDIAQSTDRYAPAVEEGCIHARQEQSHRRHHG